MPLPQMPFGLRLPGTDGFSLPQGAVPGGAMPAPFPGGMGQESDSFSFQPPPMMQEPPVAPPQGASQQSTSTPMGGQMPSPVGDSDKKGGLSTWLPLILGTVGAGIWAGKEKSLTDFGVNLMQGAVDQAFTQSEEKRKRQFELESADLKQGQEVIRDLMAIDDGSLETLENEIRSDPGFAHLAAYIGPLREAKKKHQQAISTSSDGGTKITAKEAAQLSQYYSAVKGAKEFLNKRNEKQLDEGFAERKRQAEFENKFQGAKAALKEMFPSASDDQLRQYWIKNNGPSGEFSSGVRSKMQQAAAWAVSQGKAGSAEEILSDPAKLWPAVNEFDVAMAGQRAGATAAARQPFTIENKMTPPPVVGADGKLYSPGEGTTVPQPFPSAILEKARTNNDLLKGIANIKRLAVSPAVQKELGNAFGANWRATSWQKLQDRAATMSPETKAFLQEIGSLTAEKIKSNYGTAFSSGEQERANVWIPRATDSVEKIMTAMKSFEKHAYNTLESARDSNPSWPGHSIFSPLKEREQAQRAKYDAFVALAKQKGKTPPPFETWLQVTGGN